MGSYENETKRELDNKTEVPGKLDIGTLKYFWLSNPITGNKKDSIPKFLREIEVLKNFTENERRILSNSLHMRNFDDNDVIFKQGDVGVGFYFLYSGHVEITIAAEESENSEAQEGEYVLSLDKGDYFGELALLQDRNLRNATITTRGGCTLLGVFRPDLEEMIDNHPVVAAKLLQSISMIVANRLFALTKEVKTLKYKLQQVGK
jgi:CRP/FNR family transcriptional regulator, cyclic AMP receptor protein